MEFVVVCGGEDSHEEPGDEGVKEHLDGGMVQLLVLAKDFED